MPGELVGLHKRLVSAKRALLYLHTFRRAKLQTTGLFTAIVPILNSLKRRYGLFSPLPLSNLEAPAASSVGPPPE